MPHKNITRRLLLYEAIGFMILIVVSWLDELIDLPTLLFGNPPGHNWHEAALETAVIVAAGVPTFILSRRLAKRLVYLEGFMRVCAWCRKIGVQDEWVSMEAFFQHEMKTSTSHGMCPDCFNKLAKELPAGAAERGNAEQRYEQPADAPLNRPAAIKPQPRAGPAFPASP